MQTTRVHGRPDALRGLRVTGIARSAQISLTPEALGAARDAEGPRGADAGRRVRDADSGGGDAPMVDAQSVGVLWISA